MTDDATAAWQAARTHSRPRLAYARLGEGRPILMLHGVGGDRRTWLGQAPLAAALGAALIAWDARGYGLSDPAPEFTFDDCIADIERLLDELELSNVAIVGHSMGGLIAQRFAAERPARVSALALVSTTTSLGRTMTREELDAFVAERAGSASRGIPQAEIAAQLAPRLVVPGSPGSIVRQVETMLAALRPATYAQAIEAVARFEGVPDLATIRAPTAILVGALDALTPPSAATLLAAGIRGAELHVVPGAGHMLPLEAPAATNALLTRFFRRASSTSAVRT